MQFGQLVFPAWLTEYLTNYLRATARWFFPVTVRRQMARYGHDDLRTFALSTGIWRVIWSLRCGKAVALHFDGKGIDVLRITTCINSGVTRFVVEGKLAGACISELERCWQATTSAESPESIFVDLSSVTFIDAAGKQLLALMHQQGIRLVASGLLAKCLIEEIEHSGK